MINADFQVAEGELTDFCRRWAVRELSLFGSALRRDFRPESDVDVLVTFEPGARRTLLDMARMQDELSGLFGRSVDLVSRRGIERSRNRRRREGILSSAETIYAQG